MIASNAQNKRKKEGCGKWLTTKSKTNETCSREQRIKQKVFCKPCVTNILKPIFVHTDRERKMKQSTMSQFLVEKKYQSNSDDKFSTFKAPVVTPTMKKGVSPALSEYESLWGRDENDVCNTVDNIQKGKHNMSKDFRTVNCKDSQANSSWNDVCTKVKEDQNITAKKRFHSPKRLKQSNDSMDPGIGTQAISSTRGKVQFTQWFENEVDAFMKTEDEQGPGNEDAFMKTEGEQGPGNEVAFMQHPVHKEDKNPVNKEHLFSMSDRCPSGSTLSCKSSDSEKESTFIPQFSEWFNQQIEKRTDQELSVQKINYKELAVNTIQSPAYDGSQHNSTFTQWFEANLENFKSQS